MAHPRYDNALERRLLFFLRACMCGSKRRRASTQSGMKHVYPMEEAERKRICAASLSSPAERKLMRVISLTVSKTRFHVRDRYVQRLRDSTNSECGYDETCLYCVHKDVPRPKRSPARRFSSRIIPDSLTSGP